MELELRGDLAVVTGGASGIGWACAQCLAREGCRIALWDLSPEVEEKAGTITHQLRQRLVWQDGRRKRWGGGARGGAGNGKRLGANLPPCACSGGRIRQVWLSLYQPSAK